MIATTRYAATKLDEILITHNGIPNELMAVFLRKYGVHHTSKTELVSSERLRMTETPLRRRSREHGATGSKATSTHPAFFFLTARGSLIPRTLLYMYVGKEKRRLVCEIEPA